MKLTEDEVIQILKLVEESRFDELNLEMGDLKLHVRKSGYMGAGPVGSPNPVTEANQERHRHRAQEVESKVAIIRDKEAPRVPEKKEASAPEEGLVPIAAPMLGTFYRRPSPGSPPYVEVGTFVNENDTVCLLEVMKVFNSVRAGVKGHIAKVCAESGDLVEYKQALFWVKPADKPEEKS
jgi:acetyl-CoA carboxylase biotin carboxyl carrier protein